VTEQVDDFLAHYGVVGMKWGKRNAKDSGSRDSSSQGPTRSERREVKREAKAKTFESRAANLNVTIKNLDREINALPPNARSRYKKAALNDIRNEQVANRDRALKDAKAVREGKLTSTQKKVVIGASVVAALAATYIIQDQIQSGNATRLIAKGKEQISGEAFAFKKNPKLSNPDFDADDIHMNVVKHINPDYGAMGTKMNCRRATFAYEMRRRGYDVKATKTTNANGQNVMGLMNATSPGKKIQSTRMMNLMKTGIKEAAGKSSGKPTPVSDLAENFAAGGKNKISAGFNPNAIFDRLSKEPDGSRGELGVMWSMGGGHSMAYEIVKGKPVIFDGQTGKRFELADEFRKIMPQVANSGFTRLDNLELNHDYLMRWMTNA
jgi:hypothetical protein